jgi:hypothetical protein
MSTAENLVFASGRSPRGGGMVERVERLEAQLERLAFS